MRFEVKKCDNEYCVFDNDNDKNVVAVCDVERICQKTCELLNMLHEENKQLKKENHGIQDKVIRLFDYVEVKQCVTRTEIKKWWNGGVE